MEISLKNPKITKKALEEMVKKNNFFKGNYGDVSNLLYNVYIKDLKPKDISYNQFYRYIEESIAKRDVGRLYGFYYQTQIDYNFGVYTFMTLNSDRQPVGEVHEILLLTNNEIGVLRNKNRHDRVLVGYKEILTNSDTLCYIVLPYILSQNKKKAVDNLYELINQSIAQNKLKRPF